MTEITLTLPDNLAQRARNAGLLTDNAMERLLEAAMRRESGRLLLKAAGQLQAAGLPPMGDDEIVAEVKAVRAERRAREAAKLSSRTST